MDDFLGGVALACLAAVLVMALLDGDGNNEGDDDESNT